MGQTLEHHPPAFNGPLLDTGLSLEKIKHRMALIINL